jgi:hypothetical protein
MWGNISICAAIYEDGVVGRRLLLGSYNAAHLIVFLNSIEQTCQGEGDTYVIVRHNIRFHPAEVVQTCFRNHPSPHTLLFSTLLTRFLQHGGGKCTIAIPMSVPSSFWPWDEACDDINADHCQAWICHVKRFFPRCMNNRDIHCDVDENLWPNAQDRFDAY